MKQDKLKQALDECIPDISPEIYFKLNKAHIEDIIAVWAECTEQLRKMGERLLRRFESKEE